MSNSAITIGDIFIINKPNFKHDFFGGKNPKGVKCWPIRHGQGCYGDCSDCHFRWDEQLDKLAKLPLEVLQTRAGVTITIA